MKIRTTLTAVVAATATAGFGLLSVTAASATAFTDGAPGPSDSVSAGPADTTTATDTGSPSPSDSGTATSTATATGQPTSPTDCPTFDDDSLDISMPLLPAEGTFPQQLTAGGDWKTFHIVVRNRGTATIKDVSPIITAVPLESQENGALLPMQYSNPRTHGWTPVPNRPSNGTPFTRLVLEPGTTDTLTLRIRAKAEAPAGGGFAMVGGYWNNGDGTCGNTDGDQAEFTILAAAGGGSGPSSAPDNTPSAQSGGTEQLAETGSSGGTTALLLGGGGAVAVGAAALAVARRRRSAGDHL